MSLNIAPSIVKKLMDKHKVSVDEVEECFGNVERGFLEDTRAEHKTDPISNWFIAETNRGRKLCVVFVFYPGKPPVIKTAFEPSSQRIKLYNKNT